MKEADFMPSGRQGRRPAALQFVRQLARTSSARRQETVWRTSGDVQVFDMPLVGAVDGRDPVFQAFPGGRQPVT